MGDSGAMKHAPLKNGAGIQSLQSLPDGINIIRKPYNPFPVPDPYS
jgi:hypothetical protein